MVACTATPPGADGAQRVLCVCADPGNVPLSHRDSSGFENRIAELLDQAQIETILRGHGVPLEDP